MGANSFFFLQRGRSMFSTMSMLMASLPTRGQENRFQRRFRTCIISSGCGDGPFSRPIGMSFSLSPLPTPVRSRELHLFLFFSNQTQRESYINIQIPETSLLVGCLFNIQTTSRVNQSSDPFLKTWNPSSTGDAQIGTPTPRSPGGRHDMSKRQWSGMVTNERLVDRRQRK